MAGRRGKSTHTDVTFKVDVKGKIGEVVFITGDCPALGGGNPAHAVQLWNRPDRPGRWFTRHPLQIECGKPVRYKYMILSGGEFQRFDTVERTLRCSGRVRVVTDVLDKEGDHLFDDARSETSSARSSHSGSAGDGSEFLPMRRASIASSFEMGDDGFDEPFDHANSRSTIIIATYHLPVKVYFDSKRGHWRAAFDQEHLLARKRRPRGAVWVGTIPNVVEPKDEPLIRAALWRKKCIPVYLTAEQKEHFEQGMCKDTLFGVLHNIVGVYGDKPSRWISPLLQETRWNTYIAVNKLFAATICSKFHTGDIVWIHDYHLLMCPRYVMNTRADAHVGLFLHTPFPSSEIFRTLSCRSDILSGMLAANHIGFRLYEYARHFVSSCNRIAKFPYENLAGGCLAVKVDGRQVKISVSQVGIEPEVLKARITDVSERAEDLRKKYAGDSGRVIVVGVEPVHRLAGIPLKLQAFEMFLERYPDYADKVVLVQVGTGAFRSEESKDNPVEEVMRRADLINAKFGKVVYFEQRAGMTMSDRVELFLAGDILLNTGIRDGANQHPIEFVFAQSRRPGSRPPGSVICSEFAGVSRVLVGAQRINPWQADEVALELWQAICMSTDERTKRHEANMQWIMANTTTDWANRLLADLRSCDTGGEPELAGRGHVKKRRGYGTALGKATEITIGDKLLNDEVETKLLQEFQASTRRCIILDYGGTLADGEAAVVTDDGGIVGKTSPLSRRMFEVLKSLSTDPANTVFVVSGHPCHTLSRVFKHLPNVGLASENGYFFKWGARSTVSLLGSPSGAESGTSGTDDPSEDFEALRDSAFDEDGGVAVDARSYAKKGWNIVQQHLDMSWLDIAVNIMKIYSKNTNGTYLLRKSSSVVWYYGQAEEEFGRRQANELAAHLRGMLKGFSIQVLLAQQYVEVRPNGVNKGKMVEKVLDHLKNSVDFVLCIGDDASDEKMFEILNRRSGLDRRSRGADKPAASASAAAAAAAAGAKAAAAAAADTFAGQYQTFGGSLQLGEIAEDVGDDGSDEGAGGAGAGAGAGALATGSGGGHGRHARASSFGGGGGSITLTGAVMAAPKSPVSGDGRPPLVRSRSLGVRRVHFQDPESVMPDPTGLPAPRSPEKVPKSPRSHSPGSPASRILAAGAMPALSLGGKPDVQLLARPWTLTVGMKASKSRFYVNDREHVAELLAMLSNASERAKQRRRVQSMVELSSRGGGAQGSGIPLSGARPIAREQSMMFSRLRPTRLGHDLPKALQPTNVTFGQFFKPRGDVEDDEPDAGGSSEDEGNFF